MWEGASSRVAPRPPARPPTRPRPLPPQVYSDEWEAYVKDCALFQFGGTSSSGEGAAGSRRRRLQQAEGGSTEGGSSSSSDVSGGCFPYFGDAEDFETYIDGKWFTNPALYSPPSNAWGIALSVLFFVSLTAAGLFLKY